MKPHVGGSTRNAGGNYDITMEPNTDGLFTDWPTIQLDGTLALNPTHNFPDAPFKMGPYIAETIIARGGMARVYRGTYVGRSGFERSVAIKVAAPGERSAQRLWREARVMGEIRDPRVPVVLDIGLYREWPFYAMEQVDGITLSDLVKSEQPIPVSVCLELGMALCEVLSTLHEHRREGVRRSIVHCDVKPANIMLAIDGSLKLLDFGIASVCGVQMPTRLSGGTARYMAPEQVSRSLVDGRTDIFALGVVLYELVCAERMFRETSVSRLLRNRLDVDSTLEQSRIVSQLERRCPGLAEVIMTCVKGDPARRYSDTTAVWDLLRTLRRLEPDGRGVRGWATSLFST